MRCGSRSTVTRLRLSSRFKPFLPEELAVPSGLEHPVSVEQQEVATREIDLARLPPWLREHAERRGTGAEHLDLA